MTYITETGFTKKRQDQIKSEIELAYKSIYGPEVNLSAESSNGQEIGIYSESVADLWDMLEVLYHLGDPGAAIGRTQEYLYALNGLTRNQATASTVDLQITGTPGTNIAAGFQAENSNKLVFETITAGTIGGGGTVLIQSQCTITGNNPADAGTITSILTPQAGVVSVTNPQAAIAGRSQETNSQFRLRRDLSTALPGANVIESLYTQLTDISEVRAVVIYQNRTSVIDSNGLPPHSFKPVIDGGLDADIARVIWLNTTGGVGSVGDETVQILDPNGFLVDINFQRPTLIDIYVDVVLDKMPGRYPADGDAQIRQNIVGAAAGLLEDELGGFTGFGIGQDINLSRVSPPINLVQGHSVLSLEIGLSWATLEHDNIDIGIDDRGTFSVDRIKINGALPIP